VPGYICFSLSVSKTSEVIREQGQLIVKWDFGNQDFLKLKGLEMYCARNTNSAKRFPGMAVRPVATCLLAQLSCGVHKFLSQCWT
jgi:hypothetical protein